MQGGGSSVGSPFLGYDIQQLVYETSYSTRATAVDEGLLALVVRRKGPVVSCSYLPESCTFVIEIGGMHTFTTFINHDGGP